MSDNFSFTHYNLLRVSWGTELYSKNCLLDVSKTYKTILEFFSNSYDAEDVIDENQSCFIVFFENDYEVFPANKYDDVFQNGIVSWIPYLGDECLEKILARWLEDTLTAYRKYYGF